MVALECRNSFKCRNVQQHPPIQTVCTIKRVRSGNNEMDSELTGSAACITSLRIPPQNIQQKEVDMSGKYLQNHTLRAPL